MALPCSVFLLLLFLSTKKEAKKCISCQPVVFQSGIGKGNYGSPRKSGWRSRVQSVNGGETRGDSAAALLWWQLIVARIRSTVSLFKPHLTLGPQRFRPSSRQRWARVPHQNPGTCSGCKSCAWKSSSAVTGWRSANPAGTGQTVHSGVHGPHR